MTTAVRRISQAPKLTEQVHDALTAAVLNGTLAPGELHSVNALATQFGVSRTPVREAMLQLERRGLVEVIRNQGFVVVEITAADLDEIFQIRLWLEVPSARRAAERATARDKAEIHRIADNLQASADRGDGPAVERADRLLHSRLLETAGSKRVVEIVDSLRDFMLARKQTTAGRTRGLQEIVREHDRLLAGIDANDPDEAEAGMRDHLTATRAASLRQNSDALRQSSNPLDSSKRSTT